MWGVDLYVDGVRVWHNLGVDEKAARVQEHRLRADLEEGRVVRRNPGVGFKEVAEDWLAWKEARPNARPGSVYVWRSRVKHATGYLGDIPIPAIRQEHLNRLAEDFTRTKSAATAENVASTVSSVLSYARRQGIDVPAVSFRGLLSGRRPAAGQSHSIVELAKVIAEMPAPLDGMAEVALLTGLRRGELLGVDVTDISASGMRVDGNFNAAGEMGPTKTRSGERIVSLSPRAREIVDARVKAVGDGRLWPYSLNHAGNVLRDAMQKADVYRPGHGWHAFRHGHTALLNESGMSLRDAAARLGHGAHYAQSLAYGWADEQADAAAVDEAVRGHVESSTRHDDDPG